MKLKKREIGVLMIVIVTWSISAAGAMGEIPMHAGFDRDEAMQMLKLSADLDGYGVDGVPAPDNTPWVPVASSAGDPNVPGSAACGFGPFDNCWKLWQQGSTNVYAVGIRGTIDQATSILEDFLANSLLADHVVIPAGQNATISVRLASTSYNRKQQKDWPVPEVHSGFTYGLAAILFDQGHGLLKSLQALPPGSRVYITGHSQGAAIATLLHSFLHYACADDSLAQEAARDPEDFAGCERFGLKGKNWTVKSYLYAQPKPGNWRYAMDFAEALSNKGLSFTINNYDDPVVQAPLALQLLSDSMTQQEIDALSKHRFLSFLMKTVSAFRRHISTHLDERELDREFYEKGKDGAYADQMDMRFADGSVRKSKAAGGTSVNYTPAGNIIAVRARAEDNDPRFESLRTGDTSSRDFLWEHHLWRYQELSKYWP